MKWVIPRLIPLDQRQETSCGEGMFWADHGCNGAGR